MRILIAEDDLVSRHILEANLIDWGHEPIVIDNGMEAFSLFQSEAAPQLAILDVMMPEMDGLELCKKIRVLEGVTPPYLIMLTAKSTKEDIIAGIEAGANDYLSKPCHRDELRVRLNVGIKMIELQNALSDRVKELEAALSQVKQLQGFLPICSYCKNIRNDENYWEQIESYLMQHSEAQFSHSICPGCYENNVEPMLENIKLKSKKPE